MVGVARLTLHGVAAIAAFLVVLAVSAWGGGLMIVGIAAIPAIAASQLAAFAGWPLIDRAPGSPWLAPVGAGIVMALVAHATVGVFLVLTLLAGGKSGSSLADALEFVALVATMSTMMGGWLTLPLAIAAALHVHRLRRDERQATAVVPP